MRGSRKFGLFLALFVYCLAICPERCAADTCDDINLRYYIWTSYEDMSANEIRGIVYCTLTWNRPSFSVDYYRTYRNGSASPLIGGGTSYIWQLQRRYYRGSNRVDQFYAAAQEVYNTTWEFGLLIVAADGGPNMSCSVIYEPPPPTASEPVPADGAVAGERTMILSWRAGIYSVSHDIYFGDNFDDGNDGTGGTFRRSQSTVGVAVGSGEWIFPEGLAPSTTYYWRVDERQKNGDTYRGDVWSFTTPGRASREPFPPEGAKYLKTSVEMRWTPGFGGVLHDVYLGTDSAQVRNADVLDSSGVYLGRWTDPNCSIDGLEEGRTYYWRVDEVEADGFTSTRGDTWAFTTAGSGGGVQGDYFKGTDFAEHVLSRTDPLIDFDFGVSSPDESVGRDNFSVVWTAELEAAFSETYKFYTNTDDGVRLWIDDKSVVDNWADHRLAQNSGSINLIAGKPHFLEMWWYDKNGPAAAQLSWESPRTPRQIVPEAAFSLPVHARRPSPSDGARCAQGERVLNWIAGIAAREHDVYIGTDLQKVADAGVYDNKGTYRGRRSESSFLAGQLDPGIYYWRIDEVEADGTTIHRGQIWSFTVADVIEDTVEYKVSSGNDDGYSSRSELDNLGAGYLRVGNSSFTTIPYYRAAIVFRGVGIPQGADIVSAHLKVRSYDSHLADQVYAKIGAEAADNVPEQGALYGIGAKPLTGASADWVLTEPWSPDTWYDSPDIAAVIEEVVGRPGWSAGNSLAILCSTWCDRGGYRSFCSYEHDSNHAPKLEITYIPSAN